MYDYPLYGCIEVYDIMSHGWIFRDWAGYFQLASPVTSPLFLLCCMPWGSLSPASVGPLPLGSYLDSVPSVQLGDWKEGAQLRSEYLALLIPSCGVTEEGLHASPAGHTSEVRQSCAHSALFSWVTSLSPCLLQAWR